MYRISANSFFFEFNLMYCHQRCGNYSREETTQGQKLFAEIRYLPILILPVSLNHLHNRCLLISFPPLVIDFLKLNWLISSNKGLKSYKD